MFSLTYVYNCIQVGALSWNFLIIILHLLQYQHKLPSRSWCSSKVALHRHLLRQAMTDRNLSHISLPSLLAEFPQYHRAWNLIDGPQSSHMLRVAAQRIHMFMSELWLTVCLIGFAVVFDLWKPNLNWLITVSKLIIVKILMKWAGGDLLSPTRGTDGQPKNRMLWRMLMVWRHSNA